VPESPEPVPRILKEQSIAVSTRLWSARPSALSVGTTKVPKNCDRANAAAAV
jgi:hypothetical protein